MSNGEKKGTRYLIVSGQTIRELQNNVNDIIAQGWHSEGAIIYEWKVLGGLVFDGESYLQSLIHPE